MQTTSPNSIAVLAAAHKWYTTTCAGLLHGQNRCRPELVGHVSLDGGVAYNLEAAADVLDKPISEVKVVALDRERHAQLFKEVKEAEPNSI